MASPIINITIQSCILAGTSCLIAQAITAYKSNTALSIDFTQLVQFLAFTILSTPPNFLWQTYLESSFPATHLVPSNAALRAASQNNEKELDREESTHSLLEPKLHIPNTIIKFILDQTIGAAVNTLMFSFVFAGFKGADLEQAVQISKQDFWPLIAAGWKLWPLVSALNFAVFKSVQTRNLVGGLAGIGWNIYLSLLTGQSKIE